MNEKKSKIISIDLKASFGFLKKIDVNEDIYLTYNMLHKPALLGIFGAIIGLGGYYQSFVKKKDFPEYLEAFKNLKIGITPLNSSNGSFKKTVIVYNNSVGYASKETGGNLVVKEQTLIEPSYRIYLLVNDEENTLKLIDYLRSTKSEYIPYLGKNDFQIYWDNFIEYSTLEFNTEHHSYQISSIFKKEDTLKNNMKRLMRSSSNLFIYFERLPIGFSELTKNYEFAEFVYTNALFETGLGLANLFEICKNNNDNDSENNKKVIQVF